jgi:UDPglucose 6-dehydrogenase
MKIIVVGMGYVGLSNGLLLAKANDNQSNEVIGIDLDVPRVEGLKNRQMPIEDKEGNAELQVSSMSFSTSLEENIAGADFVIVATPTSFIPETNYFDMSSVDSVIDSVKNYSPDIPIIIKSTIPIGYTKKINEKYNSINIVFSPEFLREGSAYKDVVEPSRVVVGALNHPLGESVLKLLAPPPLSLRGEAAAISKESNTPTILTNPTEAECIKLFSNTYLAMRIAYFNELDSYFLEHNLNSKDVIKGMSYDPRIGDYYNVPSFGYGGYCLPKDTKQALANFEGLDQNIIEAIVKSNSTRKSVIADDILSKNPKTIGIYKLRMKEGSDNFRDAAILDIIKLLQGKGVDVIIYEPILNDKEYMGCELVNNIDEFSKRSDVIVANRIDNELAPAALNKVYTRGF